MVWSIGACMKPICPEPADLSSIITAPGIGQHPAGLRIAARILLVIMTSLLLHIIIKRHEDMIFMLGLAAGQLGCAGFLAISSNASRLMVRLAPLACCLLLPVALLAPRSAMVAMVLISHGS